MNFGLDGGNDTQTNELGLVLGHAYSHLGHVTLSDGTRLIKCRNPWGSESYHGPWSDQSDKWTDAFKKEVNFEAQDDGIFFMELSDYYAHVADTTISFDTSNWHHAYFLGLNDAVKQGVAFSEHSLTVTSEVAQKVYISTHTHIMRDQPRECYGDYHVNKVWQIGGQDKENYHDPVKHTAVMFEAGQTKTVDVGFKWDSETELSRDWSLVAWGT